MNSLTEELTNIFASAFTTCDMAETYATVTVSNRPDLAQFQCNGALKAAKEYKQNPRQLAQKVVDALDNRTIFTDISLAGPGFINITLTDEFLATHVQKMTKDDLLGCTSAETPRKVIVDYGGPNIAKPLHVGHLRASIIGESIKRLARFKGHTVWGDVHLGDWGLQMGLVIAELAQRHPDWPYFDSAYTGPYPTESPITIDDLEEIYPTASQRSKEDESFREQAKTITVGLQQGQPGYRALWQHIVNVSGADLRADLAKLNVNFDLWLGESDVQEIIPGMVEQLTTKGHAYKSEGALVVDVAREDDTLEIPPLILIKSDGGALYGTTDLATILYRLKNYEADLILYVVDNRQHNHFEQVFRVAYKTGLVPPGVGLEHIGFGTMNGKDGKPFKTRAGGVMKLKDLISMVTNKAEERMAEINVARDYAEADKVEIARKVGMAALKFADLANHRTTDYVFDLDRFSAFEGKTGPYLLYTAVRTKSILRQAAAKGLAPGDLLPAASNVEGDVLLKLADLPNILDFAFDTRAPNHLCEYGYNLALTFNRFYNEHHILTETDSHRQASWLALSTFLVTVLETLLDLLGIEVPDRM